MSETITVTLCERLCDNANEGLDCPCTEVKWFAQQIEMIREDEREGGSG